MYKKIYILHSDVYVSSLEQSILEVNKKIIDNLAPFYK